MLVHRERIAALVFLGIALLLFSASEVLSHHMVVRCNLEEMTQKADRIFLGECIKVEQTRRQIGGGSMAVTDYTFKVESVIKGNLPPVYTFTQLGHAPGLSKPRPGDVVMHGQVATRDTMLHGAASYEVGDRLLLFLDPNYLQGKVTMPVGLYQGAFFRTTMPSGQELLRNGVNNVGLFTTPYIGSALTRDQARVILPEQSNPIARATNVDVESLIHKRGALPTESIVELIKQIHVSHGGQPGTLSSMIRTAKGASR